MKLDKRYRKGRKRARLVAIEREKKRLSFREMEEHHRGIQPLCRSCARSCKVLDGKDSTFECNDFKE